MSVRKMIMLAVVLGAWPTTAVMAESLSAGQNVFSTEKYYRAGDLITIIISESAQASQSASTDLHKDSQVGYTSGGLLGSLMPAASVGINSKNDGGGQLARQGKMKAMIGATVESILPNGLLKVKGTQEIGFDSGRQIIRIEGLVRPRDISSENEVYSYRLANVKIDYVGDGALQEKSRTGFLSRFLDWLWIF